ncbi:MAG: methylated-DNA--[protein]-cysteine S-methyltransferase [bacterium]|nr:methylated-DNA--[protein]-cysteine S-methyltransferase [bacterium]
MKRDFYHRVYSFVKKIPRGKVVSYGMVARCIGAPGAAKLVGYALHSLSFPTDVPWHRVVNAKGRISLRKLGEIGQIQKQMLESEGIVFDQNEQIDFKLYGWSGQ